MVVTFPNSPYRLHQPFEPSGDQPEAIAKLLEGVAGGMKCQTLLGVTGSGKTYTMANVVARTGRPARECLRAAPTSGAPRPCNNLRASKRM